MVLFTMRGTMVSPKDAVAVTVDPTGDYNAVAVTVDPTGDYKILLGTVITMATLNDEAEAEAIVDLGLILNWKGKVAITVLNNTEVEESWREAHEFVKN
jgi:hypothetical protein